MHRQISIGLLFAVSFSLGTILSLDVMAAPPQRAADSDGRGRETDPKGLLHPQYRLKDPSFCYASACVDVDNDGVRDMFFASRKSGELMRMRAGDGQVIWSRKLPGEQQSISAWDVDQDGDYEVIYTTSNPGRLNLIDHQGKLVRFWESTDAKLGNSPLILDADGDGELDAIFGTRSQSLMRLRLRDFAELGSRSDWVQCGCHATAMDVDGDGRWDIFAGAGDDFIRKGVLHRLDPVSLNSVWQFETNDNASSADPVLVDLDGDGMVEILKSADNYKQDDNHAGLAAYRSDGTRLWLVPGIAEEDSPNAADLNGDGRIEIVGMTFGGEVYCLDGNGQYLWKCDLRPELGEETHMYLTPILCDLNGDRQLEILAMTSGSYFDTEAQLAGQQPAILFALNAQGEILDRLDLRSPRYFGEAFVCQVDEDPYLELVLSGSGGLDVIETRGYGPDTEYCQRRRNYQRLNVLPWAYEDSYFIERGKKERVVNQTDDLVLQRADNRYVEEGRFATALLTPPPDGEFGRMEFSAEVPPGTQLRVNLLDAANRQIRGDVTSGTRLAVRQPVRLEFEFSTKSPDRTPKLNSYSLAFERPDGAAGEQGTKQHVSAALGETLVIEADDRPRTDAPAAVALDVSASKLTALHLLEITDGNERLVPGQVEPGNPPLLWWIVRGELPAHSKRKYRIEAGEAAVPSSVLVERSPDSVVLRVGESPVLQYNTAHVSPPDGLDAKYGRSAYIHPCWTPAGAIVTDQFPPDHAHQSGLFLAYTKTEFEGRTPNFWDLLGGTGQVRFKELKSTTNGPVFGEFHVIHEHVDLSGSEPKVVLIEDWKVRVWNLGGRESGFWVSDITSTINCAGDSPLRLPTYHYGGMALRGARGWDAAESHVTTAEGKDRLAGNHTRPRWCDLSGPVGKGQAGITFFTHPTNFRAPEPLRIHPTMPYMVYTPSQLGDWEISPGKPQVSRYQFVFHDGNMPAAVADRLWRNFAQPLTPTVVPRAQMHE